MHRTLRAAIAFASIAVAAFALSTFGGVSGVVVTKSAELDPLPNTILFEDDFDNRRTDGWTAHDSGDFLGPSKWWVMPHGVLAESSNTWGGSKDAADPAKPGTNFVAGNLGWKDVDVSLRMKSDDDDAMGVLFRYTGEDSYYRFSWDAERGYQRIVRRSGGTFTTIAERSVGYTPGRWYDVRVRAQGASLAVYVDGTLALSATDPMLKSGEIGLYSWGMQSAYFDDVKVRATITTGFTVAVLPDTQFYTTTSKATYATQTAWIAANRGPKKIAMVLHEGDVVTGNCFGERWDIASKAMSILEGKVPYAIAPGNHDYIRYERDGCEASNETRYFDYSHLNSTFPVDRITRASGESWGGVYAPGRASSPKYGGTSVRGVSANSYHLLDVGGAKLLLLAIEFGPDRAILDWANRIVSKYPDRTAIVVTHDYLGADGDLRGAKASDFGVAAAAGQLDGVEMWDTFVNLHPNIRVVLNGHTVQCQDSTSIDVPNPTDLCTKADGPGHAGRHTRTTKFGTKVFEMVANYQSMAPLDSNGYLRLLTFNPAAKTITVSTYSPTRKRYMPATDTRNTFTLTGVDI